MGTRRAPRVNWRAIGLIDEAENLAAALRLIALGLSTLGYEGGAVTVNASEISKRLSALKKNLQSGTPPRIS